jgi:hypothetical protein
MSSIRFSVPVLSASIATRKCNIDMYEIFAIGH